MYSRYDGCTYFSLDHKRLTVVFGERDGIKIGHVLLAVNGTPVALSSDNRAVVAVKVRVICT